MLSDTCTVYEIPATQTTRGIKKDISIIFEKDGSYHIEYREAKIKTELLWTK